MNMNFFKLKVFLTVTETMSFTKAAETLFISQSAVSKSIQDTEAELKITLFERKGNLIRLTSAGQVFQQYAQKILQEYNALRFEIEQESAVKNTILRIGSGSNRTKDILDELLISLHAQLAGLRLVVSNKNSFEIEKMLLERTLDIGIVSSITKRQGLQYKPLSIDHIILVCNKQHPLKRNKKYALSELVHYPFCMRERGSGTREVVEQFLKATGFPGDLDIILETPNDGLTAHFLLHTNSLTFLSENMLKSSRYSKKLREIPLKEGPIPRQTYLAYASGFADNPILKAVLKLVR